MLFTPLGGQSLEVLILRMEVFATDDEEPERLLPVFAEATMRGEGWKKRK